MVKAHEPFTRESFSFLDRGRMNGLVYSLNTRRVIAKQHWCDQSTTAYVYGRLSFKISFMTLFAHVPKWGAQGWRAIIKGEEDLRSEGPETVGVAG